MMMVMMVPVQMPFQPSMQQHLPMQGVPAVPEFDNQSEDRRALPSAVQARFRKTRMCTMFAQGNCNLGTSCRFAHSRDELSSAPDLKKTKLCFDFFRKQCNKVDCNFAHGYHELRHMDGVYKTELCHGFAQGKCRFGTSCRFAHGEGELVVPNQQKQQLATATPPPGVWSEAQKSTSKAKSKVFKVSNKAMPPSRRWSDIDDELEPVKDDENVSVGSLETETPESASEVDSESVAGSD
jgi:hypothetical protein